LQQVDAAFTLAHELDDPRVRRIKDLLQQATKLQDAATKLITEITDQIQRSIFIHDDRGAGREHRWDRRERRKKPRG
jgi:hypothetical protein